ncbi:MAG TPA: outer membrane beta-barrel protein [Flavisolibacter sp.]|jgi:hypothetical protein|nr:outer membrane beta-barrel protein [Flavisolibacter sp.]
MKRILFAIVLGSVASAASAQIKQGNWLVGGNTEFSFDKQGHTKTSSFELNPNVGYFVWDKLAGGLRVNLQTEKTTFQVDPDVKQNTLLIAPFVRYYFLPADQKVNLLVDGSYGFGSTKFGSSPAASVNGYEIRGGVPFFLNPHTALEFTVGYASYKTEGLADRNNTVNVGVGFQIHLGGSHGADKK